MIYTVTFNPALDYIMRFDALLLGNVCRSRSEDIFIGGKGINVSLILKELSVDSTALGFTAGFTGKIIEEELQNRGVKTDFVRLSGGFSRINVKVKAGSETDLNAHGPHIGKADIEALFKKLEALNNGDIMVLSGSVPKSLPDDIYSEIMNEVSGKAVNFAVDTTGKQLLNVLKYRPFLIKPNNFELEELFGVKIESRNDIEYYAEKLRGMGAQNVLVSLAGEGALLMDADGRCHETGAARGRVLNSVGAGDSMVAGFIAGYLETGDYAYALKLGTAAGGATAFSDGLARREDILKLADNLIDNMTDCC